MHPSQLNSTVTFVSHSLIDFTFSTSFC